MIQNSSLTERKSDPGAGKARVCRLGFATLLLGGWFLAAAAASGDGALLFRDDFSTFSESGRPDPELGWQVLQADPPGRVAEVVPDAENRFGQGTGNQVLRLGHDGESRVILQAMVPDVFAEGASPVVTIGFSFWENPANPNGRVSLRVGRARVFSDERVHEVRFRQGTLNSRENAYNPGAANRVRIVFNNSFDTLVNYHEGATLSPDRIDVWVNGERVLENQQFLRGNLPVGENLQTFSFDLPEFGSATEMLIDDLWVRRGAVVEDAAAAGSYAAWADAHGLLFDERSPETATAGDGVANLLKYAFGLDPRNPSRDGLPEVRTVEEGGQRFLAVDFQREIASTDAEIRLFRSENLEEWEAVGDAELSVVSSLENGVEQMRWRDDLPVAEEDRRFLRLEVSLAGGSENRPTVRILQDGGSPVSPLIALLEVADYNVETTETVEIADALAAKPDWFVVPPGAALPYEALPALDLFRRSGGNVAILNPHAFERQRSAGEVTPVLDFVTANDYELVIPSSSEVNPEPEVAAEIVAGPSPGKPGLEVTTRLIGDGNVLAEISLRPHRDASRSVIRFAARGDHEVDILYVRIRDDSGRNWRAFVETGFEWREYEISMADFLPSGSGAVPGVDLLDPAEARTLSIGMSRFVLWPEVGGRFALADVRLEAPSDEDYAPTGAAASWHVQYGRLGIAVPGWLENPFLGTGRLANEVWQVPAIPHERGREETELVDVLKRNSFLSRPLLFAGEDGKNAAELRRFNSGPYLGSSLALFGLAEENYAPGAEAGALLVRAMDSVSREPGLLQVSPVMGAEVASDLRLRVRVENPRGAESFAGTIAVTAAGGTVSGSREISLAPGETREVEVSLSAPPESFPWGNFSWEVRLKGADSEIVDRMADSVSVEQTLAEIAVYLLRLQAGHPDGRFSPHFFSDIYAARFLLSWARYLEERPTVLAELQETLGGRMPEDFREAAFRFADHIVATQNPDGSFPMGYGEHRGIIYVADLGQVSLGLVHLASWLAADDPRREAYIEVARRYFDFRQTFYIDEVKAAELEAIYGPDPERIRVGFYGIGLLGSDYFDGGTWPEIRREERGRAWVLPVSLGFLGGLVQLDGSERFREVADQDTAFFLQNDSGITSVSYFHVEALFWMFYVTEDPAVRAAIAAKLEEFLPTIFTGDPNDHLTYQGRAMIRWLSLLYYQRYLEDSPAVRAALLKGIWASASGSLPASAKGIAERYPATVYGPSIASLRYSAFAGIFLLELLDEGSSLLRDVPFP